MIVEDNCWSFVDDADAWFRFHLWYQCEHPDDVGDAYGDVSDAVGDQEEEEDNVGVLLGWQPLPCLVLQLLK